MATVNDIGTDALRRLGVYDAVETITAADSALCLTVLNQILDQMAAENLYIYDPNTRTTFTITSGTQEYAVGTGQVVNRARPDIINSVKFQDTSTSPVVEYQTLQPLTDEAYSNIVLKTQTAPLPIYYYWKPEYPYAKIWFWPVPTSTTLQGVLYAPTAITQFTSTTDSFDLPPGYRMLLTLWLAMELTNYFKEAGIPQGLPQALANAKAVVERINTRMLDMSVDTGALVQGAQSILYSIYSDT